MAYDPEARETSNSALIIGIVALVLVIGGALAYYATNSSAPTESSPTVVVDRQVISPAPTAVVAQSPIVIEKGVPVPGPATHTTVDRTTTTTRTIPAPPPNTGKSNPASAGTPSASNATSTSTTTTTATDNAASDSGSASGNAATGNTSSNAGY